MPEDLNLPLPHGFLFRNIETQEEVVLIYDEVYMYDSRPDSEYLIDAVMYMDNENALITYPKHLWSEEYEAVPVSIPLFDEYET